MTIKIQAWQSRGVVADKIVDEFEFCCWQSLYEWLGNFSKLHKCAKCNLKESVGNTH